MPSIASLKQSAAGKKRRHEWKLVDEEEFDLSKKSLFGPAQAVKKNVGESSSACDPDLVKVHNCDDQGSTGVQSRDDQGSTGVQSRDDQGSTGVQSRDDQGSTGVQSRDDQGSTGVQSRDDQGSTGVQSRDDQGSTGVQSRDDQGSTGVQSRDDQGSTGVQSHDDQGSTGVQSHDDQGSTGVQSRDDQGSTGVQNTEAKITKVLPVGKAQSFRSAVLPRRSSMLDLLIFLATQQRENKGKPVFISRKELAAKAHLSMDTVKTSLARLKTRELIQTVDRHFSCRAGGASYFVTKSAFKLLDSADEKKLSRASESVSNPGSKPTLVSSQDLNNPHTDNTQNIEMEKHAYNSLVRKLNLDQEYKIGASHLADWHRQSGLNIQGFSESVEHAVFYVSSEQSVGIRDSLQWLASKLKKGYFHEPPDFVSADERFEQIRLEAAQRKAANVKKLKQQTLSAEFDVMWMSFSNEQKTAYLRVDETGRLFADEPNGRAAKEAAKSQFWTQHGEIFEERGE